MADTSKQFTFTMAPGQVNTGSNSFPMKLGPSRVDRIIVSFPPGCAFFVNCQIRCGGSAVFPNQEGAFFHFDGYNFDVPVTTDHLNGDWAIAIANTDSLQHEIQVNIQYQYLEKGTLTSDILPTSL